MKRVFNIDIETCDKCGGEVRIIASIKDPAVIRTLLTELRDPRHVKLTDLQRIDGELPDSMQQPDRALQQLLKQTAPHCARP